MAATKLRRSRDSYVAGVCAGIAKAFDVDTLVIRILAILAVLTTFGAAAVIYVFLWIAIPLEQPEGDAASYEVTPVLVNSENRSASPFGVVAAPPTTASQAGAKRAAPSFLGRAFAKDADLRDSQNLSLSVRVAVAVGLIVLFLIVSMGISPMLHGTHWWQLWPVAFLIAGLCLIVIPVHTRFEAVWHAAGIAISSLAVLCVPMSVGILSWATIPSACATLWFVLVAAIVLFVVGMHRGSGALVIASALCVMLFCLVALFYLGVPGDIEEFAVYLPNGRSFFMGPGFTVRQFSWISLFM